MDGTKKGAKEMTEEERAELIKKLDDQMEDYLAQKEAKAKAGPGYQNGWKEETWEEEMESHPFFASNDKILEDAAKGKLNPMMEGLQNLKYSAEENTSEELAKNYKDDGNFQFKLKKYRLAVAAYTEGIRCKSEDIITNVQLITNRAAAQFHLKNYRSSFNDCALAVKLKEDHFKAIKRGVLCCYNLKNYSDCILWSEKALKLDPSDSELQSILEKSMHEVKEAERNTRRETARKKKKEKEDVNLIKALKSRKIRLADIELPKVDPDKEDMLIEVLEKITPILPAVAGKRVHFSEEDDQTLIWPVLFMYPEYGQTDMIEEFEEVGQTFEDHLQAMFGHGIERPNWDISNKYHPEKLKIYFEDKVTNPDKVALTPIDNNNVTLSEALSNSRFSITNGLPTFIILVEKSHYETFMIKSYENPALKG